jgi:hypothetical protein
MASNDEPIPFTSRLLTKSERRKEDLYIFKSPKLGRNIEVIGPLRLALSLKLDFNPDTTVYVERPRTLLVRNKQIELGFWSREVRGRERFWLVVPATETIQDANKVRQHRHWRDLVDAANEASIGLEFVYESELLAMSTSICCWFHLLPFVQAAQSMLHRHPLRNEVRTVFETISQASFSQIEQALPSFHPADVRAITCDLIHAGELEISTNSSLQTTTIVRRRTAHG